MHDYDHALFNLPAPLALVSLRHPSHGNSRYDRPRRCLIRGVSIDPQRSYELMGFDGNRTVTPFVEADLLFLSKTFKGRFLLIDQEWGLMGRDVLNHVSLLFDGVRLTWGESASEAS